MEEALLQHVCHKKTRRSGFQMSNGAGKVRVVMYVINVMMYVFYSSTELLHYIRTDLDGSRTP
jgi:hypothetical protein